MSPITQAIRKGSRWLSRFTRREYAKAFKEYCALHRDPCMAQLESHREDPEALAGQILQELEEELRKTRFWNRAAEKFDEKQMLIKYFSPMLLQQGEETFARCLRDAWCSRWPKDPYEMASFETLDSSFVNVIMGITLKDDK